MTRRVCGAVALPLALAFSLPSAASADITIGSTTKPGGSTGATGGSAVQTFVQVGSASFPIAVPAGGGRIAQWSTSTAGSGPGATVQLVVLRPSGGTSYTVLAVDSRMLPSPVPASQVATFRLTTPIAVNAGDKIGLNTPSNNAVVEWSGGATPSTDLTQVMSTVSPSPPAPGQTVGPFGTASALRVNVSAVVSQSADVGVTASTTPTSTSVRSIADLGSTVTNHSPATSRITFTDTVPTGLTISSAFVGGDGLCTASGQAVTCTIVNLAGGSSVPVNVLVTPQATGSYVNHVSVAPAGGTNDPNPSNNNATATLRVRNTVPSTCIVPKLRRTPARVAKRVLRLLGCKVKVKRKKGKGVAHGLVLKTKPKPGTYKLGRKVTLIVRR